MRYEFYAAIIALATAIVNSFNGNQCTKGEGRASCQCQATCQNGAEIPTSIEVTTIQKKSNNRYDRSPKRRS